MKRFFSFLISKSFLIQLIIAIVLLMVGFMITLTAISNYTNHGESYEVPTLRGVNVQDAEMLLEKNKMNLVIADSLFVDDEAPGAVLEQQPKAGQQVKEGRKVFVTICATNPDKILMPQLTDVSFRQAVSIIQASGLRIGDITYEASEYENLVLSQRYKSDEIVAGEPIAKGAYIDLVVGRKGHVGRTAVPYLKGMSKDEVQIVLDSLQLTMGAVIYDSSVLTAEDTFIARVARQKPMVDGEQELQVDFGSLVDIWLSADSTQYLDLTEEVEDSADVETIEFEDF
ncbi:MAG: PASTA domain-containing protein [Mangrovibacterium sp.]